MSRLSLVLSRFFFVTPPLVYSCPGKLMPSHSRPVAAYLCRPAGRRGERHPRISTEGVMFLAIHPCIILKHTKKIINNQQINTFIRLLLT